MELNLKNSTNPSFVLDQNFEISSSNKAYRELELDFPSFKQKLKNWLHLQKQSESEIVLGELPELVGKQIILFRFEQQSLYGVVVDSSEKVKTLESKLRETEFLVSKITEERANSTILTVNALKERNIAFDELKKIQDQTQLIINTVGEGVLMLKADGIITYANPTAKMLISKDLEHVCFFDLIKDDLSRTKLKQKLEFGEDCVETEMLVKSAEGIKTMEVNFRPIHTGEAHGGVLSFRDISKRKEAEELKRRNLNSQLIALSSQMTPHFIFNALSSIQHFILNSDVKDSLDYISHFSALMRTTLNNSTKKIISIDEEIEFLEEYLRIENTRLEGALDYKIINETNEEVFVPPMLVQPYVENAIIHGFNGIRYNGEIKVTFSQEDEYLIITIQDNGIGRKKASKENKKTLNHKSFGMQLTKTKLELLSSEQLKSGIQIEDLKGTNEKKGTRVTLKIPVNLSL